MTVASSAPSHNGDNDKTLLLRSVTSNSIQEQADLFKRRAGDIIQDALNCTSSIHFDDGFSSSDQEDFGWLMIPDVSSSNAESNASTIGSNSMLWNLETSQADDFERNWILSLPGSNLKNLTIVHKEYEDHLHDPKGVTDTVGLLDSPRLKRPRNGVVEPFPERLYKMLSRMDTENTSHIISWQPHGRCFVVHNPKEFAAKVMPR
jgi:hypothetical protein